MRFFFQIIPFFLGVFIPAVTMRTWAEERRHGTIEFLMTLPLKLSTLVLTKFFANITFLCITIFASIIIPAILIIAWQSDPGPIFAGYLGTLFMGFFFIAIGMFISSITRDQIVAFLISFILCYFFIFVGDNSLTNWIDGWAKGVGTFLRTQFGVTEHLEPFQRGIVNISGLIFFLAMSTIFLCLNTCTLYSLSDTKERGRFTIAGFLIIGIGILVSLNASEARIGRIDLTEGKLYTITDATKRILTRLKAPVEVTYFVTNSEKMPSDGKHLERDVTDVLRELSNLSTRFTFHVEDAAKSDSKLKEKKIGPVRWRTSDKDELRFVLVYSAITINYLNKPEENIDWIGPEQTSILEFELMSRIHRLTLESKPKVAMYPKIELQPWMRQHPQFMPEQYEDVEKYLDSQGYQVVRTKIASSDPIPSDADSLLVIGPENLNDRQLYEINKFIRSGRPVIIAIQKFSLSFDTKLDLETMQPFYSVYSKKIEPKTEKLLDAFGINIDDNILMDASFVGQFPMYLHITQENMDREASFTNGVGSIVCPGGSILKTDEKKIKSGLTMKVLASSSKRSWTAPTSIELSQRDLRTERFEYLGKQPVAILLSGKFPNAFESGPIPTWPEGGGDLKPLETVTPSKIVVLGCAQMFSDQIFNHRDFDNNTFLLNSMDILTHGDDLAQIRSKQSPIRRIGDIPSHDAFFYRLVMTGLMPLLLVIFGIIRLVIRRKSRQSYQKSLVKVT